jgi:hypothetical protein
LTLIDEERDPARGILAFAMSPAPRPPGPLSFVIGRIPRRPGLLSLVALVCVSALIAANCHGSDKKKVTPSTVPTTDTKGKPSVSLAVRLGSLSVLAVDTAKPFDRATAQKILKLVNDYIADGMTKPLFTGADSKSLAAYFAPSLASRIGSKGHDRAALTDEHVPPLTSVTKTAEKPLALSGLQKGGRLLMIGAQLAISVKGATADGPLAISRVGNLVFEPDSKHHWHITGYTLVVQRDTGTTSTTQKATTTTAAH